MYLSNIIKSIQGTDYEDWVPILLEKNQDKIELSRLLEIAAILKKNEKLYYKLLNNSINKDPKLLIREDVFQILPPDLRQSLFNINIEIYLEKLSVTELLTLIKQLDPIKNSDIKDQTYLYITKLKNGQINEIINNINPSKIVSIKIDLVENEEEILELLKLFSNLKIINLNQAIKNKEIEEQLIKFSKEKGFELQLKDLKLNPILFEEKKTNNYYNINPNPSFNQDSNQSFNPNIGLDKFNFGFNISPSLPESSKPKGKLFIAQGNFANQIDIKDSSAKFNMFEVGEVLNDKSLIPQIRTSVIKYNNIQKNLEQKEYFPSRFEVINKVKNLGESDINSFKNKTDGAYYHFNQQLEANKTVRLLSADAGEELIGIMGIDPELIEIKKGDDGFLYVKPKQNHQLSYVTKVEKKLDYASIPQHNAIRKVIDEYKNPNKGYKDNSGMSSKMPEYKAKEHSKWMEEIYNGRLGSCSHRVAAVAWKLLQEDVSTADFRVVDINKNHVALEIKHDDKWYSVDLGGGSSEMSYDSNTKPYKASAIDLEKQFSSLTKEIKYKEAEIGYIKYDSDGEDGENYPIASDKQSSHEDEIIIKEMEIIKTNMTKQFGQILELEKIRTEQELIEKVSQSANTKILLVTNNKTKEQSNLLLKATKDNSLVYYIDSPDKIDINRPALSINKILFLNIEEEEECSINQQGLLKKFLEDPNPNKILIIDWDKFSSKEKVKLNTILDLEPTIQGVKIDNNTKIISLCNGVPKDPSFLSRHKICLDSSQVTIVNDKLNFSNKDEIKKIDLQGLSNWRETLFGPIILNKDKIEWRKSSFIYFLIPQKKNHTEILYNLPKNIKILNSSAKNIKEMEYEFNKAKALGYFEYHGHKIKLPKDFNISFDDKSFDFSKFDKNISLTNSVTINDYPADCKIINTYLFDSLLHGKKIEENFYQQTDGLIEETNKTENKILKLFITSQLSDDQWYCLLEQAQIKEVKLDLYLGKGIIMPKSVKVIENNQNFFDKIEEQNIKKPIIYLSKNPTETLNKLLKDKKDFIVIDIEDFSYQDLVEKIHFKTTNYGFEQFQKIQSEVLKELNSGKKVILKGEFAPDLLQMLHPMLISQKSEFEGIGDNLIMIIEDKKNISKSLEWLGQNLVLDKQVLINNFFQDELRQDLISNQGIQNLIKKNPNIIYRESADKEIDLNNSKLKSDKFIKDRKDFFIKFLTEDDNSMLQLVGHSGVGKSGLIREFEKHDKDKVTIYRELANFENWANDKSNKLKIFFIDESNIEDSHLTKFSSLKKGGNRNILHEGKLYQLSENHKVVFARNPKEYGGGRSNQKLFEDGNIPEIHLKDFPVSYIYEKILKESIYDKTNSNIKNIVTEERFKKKCKELIENYQKINSDKSNNKRENLTVRELQAQAFQYLANEYQPITDLNLQTENFVSTEATKEVESVINSCLTIRQLQRDGFFPNQAGINGVVLEGDSGTGKSEMIKSILESKGILPIPTDQDLNKNHQYYFKLDASLNLTEKKDIITYAFNKGIVLWIDEINSCIDDGLEKVLNSVLTGAHPDTGKSAEKSGFIVLATANGIDLEGRSQISPALLHRFHHPKVKGLKEYKLEDFKKIAVSMKSAEQSKDFAKKCAYVFYDLVQENPDLNLRMFKQVFKTIKEEEKDKDVKQESEEEKEISYKKIPLEEEFIDKPSTKIKKPSANELQNQEDIIKSFFERVLKQINKNVRKSNYHHIDLEVDKNEDKIKLINTQPNTNASEKYKIKRATSDTIPTLRKIVREINKEYNDNNLLITINVESNTKEITFTIKDKDKLSQEIRKKQEDIIHKFLNKATGCFR